MADEILDSHEQGEQVRRWLEKNATSIIVGLLVGLLAVFGGKRWNESRAAHRGEAMSQYQQMLAPDNDAETFDAHYQALTESYSDTPYAGLAVLAKAQRQLSAEGAEAAIEQLQIAAKQAVPEGVNAIARLRLARALIAADRADEALAQLQDLKTAGFKAAIAEVRGDALSRKGDRAAAETAYQDALTHMDVSAPGRDVVEMKLSDMAASTTVAQATEASPEAAAETPPVDDAAVSEEEASS